jgi:hypothetical protein
VTSTEQDILDTVPFIRLTAAIKTFALAKDALEAERAVFGSTVEHTVALQALRLVCDNAWSEVKSTYDTFAAVKVDNVPLLDYLLAEMGTTSEY